MIEKRSQVAPVMIKHGIPTHMIGGMERYLFDQVPPGGFMRSVLENSFCESVVRADPQNRDVLEGWAKFLMNEVSKRCWGSPEKVEAWLNTKERRD